MAAVMTWMITGAMVTSRAISTFAVAERGWTVTLARTAGLASAPGRWRRNDPRTVVADSRPTGLGGGATGADHAGDGPDRSALVTTPTAASRLDQPSSDIRVRPGTGAWAAGTTLAAYWGLTGVGFLLRLVNDPTVDVPDQLFTRLI
jgi:hypothetical protein